MQVWGTTFIFNVPLTRPILGDVLLSIWRAKERGSLAFHRFAQSDSFGAVMLEATRKEFEAAKTIKMLLYNPASSREKPGQYVITPCHPGLGRR